MSMRRVQFEEGEDGHQTTNVTSSIDRNSSAKNRPTGNWEGQKDYSNQHRRETFNYE